MLTAVLFFVSVVRVHYALFVTWHFSSRLYPLNRNLSRGLSPLSFEI